ncbi:MAG: hypothetical protein ACR2GH_18480 [Pseudonocardia sp.]
MASLVVSGCCAVIVVAVARGVVEIVLLRPAARRPAFGPNGLRALGCRIAVGGVVLQSAPQRAATAEARHGTALC